MVPTRPGANLVVGQTGFTLAALNALFDAVLGFGNASEFLARCVGCAIGQVIVVLQRTDGSAARVTTNVSSGPIRLRSVLATTRVTATSTTNGP